MHLQNQPHMRNLGPSPPRLHPHHGPSSHHQNGPHPSSADLVNTFPRASHSHQRDDHSHPLGGCLDRLNGQHSRPMSPQRAPLQKLQPHNMSPQNQQNGHYSHSHQHQQNGETRPSVIESSQPLIIECT